MRTNRPSAITACAQERCGEHFYELASGRKLCYFKDGDSSPNPVLVLAFHGGCEGKYKFMMKTPMPGILLVSVDRPGYGKSCAAPAEYSFEDAARDVLALAKHLGYDQFVVCGHSIGGFWAQQLAAALPNNVRGCILWASVIDGGSAKATAKFISDAGRPPSIMHPSRGLCGCILKSSFSQYAAKGARYDFKENVKEEMRKAPAGYQLFKNDPFWVSAQIYSWQAFHTPAGILTDADMCLFAGTHGLVAGLRGHQEVANIKCPIYVYHGEKDFDLGTRHPGATNYFRHLWPDAVIEVIPDVGHICVIGPTEETQARFAKAVAAMPPLSRDTVTTSTVSATQIPNPVVMESA